MLGVNTWVYAGDSLEGFRCLDTLLEAAAVRYAAEEAGNILRVIHIAEAEEYLVFFVGIEVAADVELLLCSDRLGLIA